MSATPPPDTFGYHDAVQHGLDSVRPDMHAFVDQIFATVTKFNGWVVGSLVAWLVFELAMWLLERSRERKRPVQLELF